MRLDISQDGLSSQVHHFVCYIVNIEYARKLTQDGLLLLNGTELPVSRQQRPALKRAMGNFFDL